MRSTVKTLLTYLPTNLLTSKKAAFTLAEVLITLGIIGVVAAVTMPILITNHQKKVFATKVKQTYSLVSQVLASSVAENGAPNTWNFGEKVENNGTNTLNSPDAVDNLMKTYFLPYFKNVGYGRGDGFYPYIRLANGTTLTFFTDGGTSNGIYTPEQLYIVAGFTGTTSAYSNSKRDYSKKDVFMRVSVSQPYAKLLFFSWGTKDRENLKNSSYYSCNKNNSANLRYNCGALIQVDGWEIKSDYPW